METEAFPGDDSIVTKPKTIGQLRRQSERELKEKTKALYEARRAERAGAERADVVTAPQPNLPRAMALTPSRVQLLRSARNVWAVDAPAGIDPDALLNYSIWRNMAVHFRPGDTVEVLAEDFKFWARYLVVDASKTGAKLCKLEFVPVGESPNDRSLPIDGHTIKWLSPAQGARWGVIRDRDNVKVQAGFPTREAALTWLVSHLKAIAR